MTSRWHTNWEHSVFAMLIQRTRNVWCLELISAELEAVAEAVYDVQAYNSRFLIKAHHVRLKNKDCMMSWINTCLTWSCCGSCLWHPSRQQQSFHKSIPCSIEEQRMYDVLN